MHTHAEAHTVMDYSGDCCRSAVCRMAMRGYDSSKLECVFLCVYLCVKQKWPLQAQHAPRGDSSYCVFKWFLRQVGVCWLCWWSLAEKISTAILCDMVARINFYFCFLPSTSGLQKQYLSQFMNDLCVRSWCNILKSRGPELKLCMFWHKRSKIKFPNFLT